MHRHAIDQVTLLMGIRDGAAHLPSQLHSIARQDHPHWHLVASDDGSTDNSPRHLRRFAGCHPARVTVANGPGEGFSENYMSMLRALPDTPGFVGFADQDDIWIPDKLSRAVALLDGEAEKPALYCGRRWDWNPETGGTRATRAPDQPLTFRNALIENVAFGNTILLNPAAARLARHAATRTKGVFAHDWWLYLLITGSGGRVVFDDGPPVVFYRQHRRNAIGAGRGVLAQVRRKQAVLRGALADRITRNLAAMDRVRDLLTPAAIATLDGFDKARGLPVLPRLAGLRQIAPYRQGRMATLGFWGAASLGRV